MEFGNIKYNGDVDEIETDSCKNKEGLDIG